MLNKNRAGSIILPSGERITKAEQKAFRSAVANANALRNREIERLSGTGKQVYRDFGKTSDNILTKKSASFTKDVEGIKVPRFKNKQDFLNQLERAQSVTKMVRNRERTYKQNTIQALETQYGKNDPLVKKVSQKILGMRGRQFSQKVDSGEIEGGVEYLYYDPEKAKLKKMANSLGIEYEDSNGIKTVSKRK